MAVNRNVYSANLAQAVVAGGGDGFGNGAGISIALHVAPEVAAGSGAGSGVQVTWIWNDGVVDVQDDTIISLDTLAGGQTKQVLMWGATGTTITLEATMFAGNTLMPGYVAPQYRIDWNPSIVLG